MKRTEVVFPESPKNPVVVFETVQEGTDKLTTQYINLRYAYSIRVARSTLAVGFSGGEIVVDGVDAEDAAHIAEKWLDLQP
tara:strand:+ start:1874 stop:2116 length:243 start_codon:yes stop_codon:yes gene_type:complete